MFTISIVNLSSVSHQYGHYVYNNSSSTHMVLILNFIYMTTLFLFEALYLLYRLLEMKIKIFHKINLLTYN